MKFYAETPPQTAEGALNYAVALKAKGRNGDAEADIVTAWRTMPMGSGLQKDYLENFGKLLKPHHEARLDRMLWDGHLVSAGQMLSLVSTDQRKLAEARIALQKRLPGVDGKVSAVPKSLAGSPGLAFDRFVWRDRKELDDSAIELMLTRSTGPHALGEPDKWAEGRRRLARLVMRQGNASRAYDIAASHHMTPEMGYGYADLEWLAGFLALRKLNDPDTAVRHFQNFSGAVKSPISKGVAAIGWAGPMRRRAMRTKPMRRLPRARIIKPRSTGCWRPSRSGAPLTPNSPTQDARPTGSRPGSPVPAFWRQDCCSCARAKTIWRNGF